LGTQEEEDGRTTCEDSYMIGSGHWAYLDDDDDDKLHTDNWNGLQHCMLIEDS
jgi:hypothetical protein